MDNDIRNTPGSGSGSTRDKVRGKAAEVAGMAKEKIADQYDQKKDRAMNEVEHLASALRRAGENLRDEGNSSIGAAVLSRVAGRLESVGSSMEGKDLDGLMRDVERLARRNPAAFIGGAMLLGFAASRFLKSSSPSTGYDYDTRDLTEFSGDYRPTGFSGAGYGTASGFDTFSPGTGRTSGAGSTGLSGSGDLGSGLGSTGIGSTGIGSTGSTGIGSTGTSGTTGTTGTGTTRPGGNRKPGSGNSGSGSGSSGSTGGL